MKHKQCLELARLLRAPVSSSPARMIGSCARKCTGEGDDKPILLVLDDFEALLDPPDGGSHWQVKPAIEAPLSAII